jgi:hypothetical protein
LATGLFGLGGGRASHHGVSKCAKLRIEEQQMTKSRQQSQKSQKSCPGVVKRLEKEFEEVSVPERRKIANEIRRRKMLFA